MNLVLAAFLVAHAAIHIAYLTPTPPRTAGGPEWPFELGRSRLVTAVHLDPSSVRILGSVLVTATIILFGGAALATMGWLPTTWWPGLVTAGASASLVTLALCFHPWLVLGIGIDVLLLWLTLVARWMPSSGAG